MDKQNVQLFIRLLLTPVLLILLGLILIVHPDFGSALIAKVIGWAAIVIGAGCVFSAGKFRTRMVSKIVFAMICFVVGGWLLRNPLELAAAIGRIAGILLTYRGIQDLVNARRWGAGITYSLITTAVGILLIVLPMTTSRLVMSVCGVLLVILGSATALERLKLRGGQSGPDDPNIIDV